ncbi:unnamed protein product [Ambrosiozyma monospora]|uniref:Unnamed protein product n=1 Tax=Ambrosiozyma monospora TaxID=43982 RepID=A0A9W6YKJ9_AMBMO|nr:unnamed protein product [Ambrosiozyma monospora]
MARVIRVKTKQEQQHPNNYKSQNMNNTNLKSPFDEEARANPPTTSELAKACEIIRRILDVKDPAGSIYGKDAEGNPNRPKINIDDLPKLFMESPVEYLKFIAVNWYENMPGQDFDFSSVEQMTRVSYHNLPDGCKVQRVLDRYDSQISRTYTVAPYTSFDSYSTKSLCIGSTFFEPWNYMIASDFPYDSFRNYLITNSIIKRLKSDKESDKELDERLELPTMFSPEPEFVDSPDTTYDNRWISNSSIGADPDKTKVMMTSTDVNKIWNSFKILFFDPCEQELKQYSRVSQQVSEGGSFVFTFLQFARIFPFLPQMKWSKKNSKWYTVVGYEHMIHDGNFICSTQFEDKNGPAKKQRISMYRSSRKKIAKCPVTYKIIIDGLHKVVFLNAGSGHDESCCNHRKESCYPILRKIAVKKRTGKKTPQTVMEEIKSDYSVDCLPLLEIIKRLLENKDSLTKLVHDSAHGRELPKEVFNLLTEGSVEFWGKVSALKEFLEPLAELVKKSETPYYRLSDYIADFVSISKNMLHLYQQNPQICLRYGESFYGTMRQIFQRYINKETAVLALIFNVSLRFKPSEEAKSMAMKAMKKLAKRSTVLDALDDDDPADATTNNFSFFLSNNIQRMRKREIEEDLQN